MNRIVVAGLLAGVTALPAAAQTTPAPAPTATAGARMPVTRMIVFGDSLADGGYYLALDPRLPRDAGRFTTNPDPVAPEVTAARLGLPLAPVYGRGGTNYAVGGARVTLPNALSIPIATQIGNFLSAGGSFGPRDLVYVQGGGNDYFAFLAGGGTTPAILTTAATQLAAQVARIQAAGASRIVTMSVQSGGAAPLQLYNRTYGAALAAAGVNALYFDADRLFGEFVATPGAFGFTNVTGVACTVPSSLACTRATLVAPDAGETFILADSVHPAGRAQRIQGQAIASLIQAPEQIAGLGYAAQAMFRAQRDLVEGPARGGSQRDDRALSVFGAGAYHYYSSGGSAQRVGITERGFTGAGGIDLAIGEASGVGIFGGYAHGTGDFGGGAAGDYRPRAWSAGGYGRLDVGPARIVADGAYGQVDYRRIRRTLILGNTVRGDTGSTDGRYVAARLTAAADLLVAGDLAAGPDVAVQYDRVSLDGFSDGTSSTAATFGDMRIRSLTGRFGAVVRSRPGAPTRVFARAGYEREFDDAARNFTITPAGAPIAWTTPVARADRNYLSYAMSVDGRILGPVSLRGGVAGQALRDGRDSVTAFAGLSSAF